MYKENLNLLNIRLSIMELKVNLNLLNIRLRRMEFKLSFA
jgi:hypothetical protein